MDPKLTAVAVFNMVASVIMGVAWLLRDRPSDIAADRLDVLVDKGIRGGKESSADLLLKQALQEVDRKNLLDAITPSLASLDRVFEQADANIRPSALFALALGLGMVGAILSAFIARSVFVAPVGAVIFFALPFLWLWNKRRTRLKKFASQLSDGLELVARALRAGHSLAAGMHVVAEEMPPPISKEVGRGYEEQNHGIPPDEALRGTTNRVPNPA